MNKGTERRLQLTKLINKFKSYGNSQLSKVILELLNKNNDGATILLLFVSIVL